MLEFTSHLRCIWAAAKPRQITMPPQQEYRKVQGFARHEFELPIGGFAQTSSRPAF
jgi:hypothetical protein